MRLIIISSSFPRNETDSKNAGVFVRQLACMLVEAGHTVTVLTPQTVEDPLAPFDVRTFPWFGQETSISHIAPRGPRNLARLAFLMLSGVLRGTQVIRAERPDRVIALWAVPSGIIALVAGMVTRIPYDVWALGSDVWRIDDYPFGRRILKKVLRAASRRFADGYELSDEVVEISALPCSFLPSSRVLPFAAMREPRPQTTRVELLCVSRFHHHKGVDVLVKALSLLEPEYLARIHLTIRGGGPEEPQIRSLVRSLDLREIVTVGGYIDANALVETAQSTDLAIIPSRIESIPLVLSDLAQCNIPMIVTDAGDLGNIATRFDAARVVPPDDPQSIAAAISDFLSGAECGSATGRVLLSEALSLKKSMERLTSA